MSDTVSTVPVSTGINTYTEAMKLVEQMNLPKIYDASNPNSRVFFALADGTENDVNNSDMGPATNVGILYKQLTKTLDINPNSDISIAYKEGPGTQGGIEGGLDSGFGFSYDERAEELYTAFCKQAKTWLAENPNAEISLGELGFSRGSAVIAKFNQLVHERGIVDPDSAVESINRNNSDDPTQWSREITYEKVLQVPGTIAQSVIVYDPVFTGVTESLSLSSSTISAAQFTALNENRALFASTSLVSSGLSDDGRYLNAYLAGSHSDIGGGYSENGLSSLTFNMTSKVINTMLGQEIVSSITLPTDENAYVIHNSIEGEWFYTKTLSREVKYAEYLAGGSLSEDGSLVNAYTYASLLNSDLNSALGLSIELQEHISEIVATVTSGVSNLIDGVATYGPSILDALSLIKAIQSGEQLPIVVSGIRLANDVAILNNSGNTYLSAAASVATGVLSVMSLSEALKNGDALGAVVSGSSAIAYAASAYIDFTGTTSGLATEISATLMGTGTNALGLTNGVLPYLSLVNAIAEGDEVGITVATASLFPGMQWVGVAYGVYSMVDSLFGGHDIPDPWGTGRFVWDGTSIKIQSAGETGGNEAVSGIMQSVLTSMNSLIEQQRLTNPTSSLGIIVNRMPSVAYDMSGYRYTDIDPLTGEERHPSLRFDTSGNPYNATVGSTESYRSIGEAIIMSALERSAIAPMWEVQTAKMQTDAGDPKAGLTEEARANNFIEKRRVA